MPYLIIDFIKSELKDLDLELTTKLDGREELILNWN